MMSAPPRRPSPVPRRVAAVLLAAAGVVHLVLAPEYLREAPLIGALFLLAGPVTMLPAVVIWRTGDRRGWALGALVSVAMIAGFVLSRTVGLLGYSSGDWVEGVPALALEVAFLVVAAALTGGGLPVGSRQNRLETAD